MNICIPTVSDAGAAARLSPHFGRAPFFTLVDVESGRAETVRNRDPQHEHGRCDPLGALEGGGVHAVVCRGMGSHALERLAARGVPVLATDAWLVADALQAFREGRLPRLTREDAGHHDHG